MTSTIERSLHGGDAALRQITLLVHVHFPQIMSFSKSRGRGLHLQSDVEPLHRYGPGLLHYSEHSLPISKVGLRMRVIYCGMVSCELWRRASLIPYGGADSVGTMGATSPTAKNVWRQLPYFRLHRRLKTSKNKRNGRKQIRSNGST